MDGLENFVAETANNKAQLTDKEIRLRCVEAASKYASEQAKIYRVYSLEELSQRMYDFVMDGDKKE